MRVKTPQCYKDTSSSTYTSEIGGSQGAIGREVVLKKREVKSIPAIDGLKEFTVVQLCVENAIREFC